MRKIGTTIYIEGLVSWTLRVADDDPLDAHKNLAT